MRDEWVRVTDNGAIEPFKGRFVAIKTNVVAYGSDKCWTNEEDVYFGYVLISDEGHCSDFYKLTKPREINSTSKFSVAVINSKPDGFVELREATPEELRQIALAVENRDAEFDYQRVHAGQNILRQLEKEASLKAGSLDPSP